MSETDERYKPRYKWKGLDTLPEGYVIDIKAFEDYFDRMKSMTNISNIKEQIEAIPDDRSVLIYYDDVDHGWPPDFNLTDLKALASSHTALLEAIKQDYAISVKVLSEWTASTAFALSMDAVRQAEGER